MENIKWNYFKEQLQAMPQLALQFQYAADKWVDTSYHITEIKQALVTSVDCGGVVNRWTEVIIQLWEPANERQQEAMKVEKALSIITLVEKHLPLADDAIVKIEFGNALFDTRQMLPKSVAVNGANLVVDLRPDAVQCKAIERGGSCGTSSEEECCTPVAEIKPIIQLQSMPSAAACCAPGTNCC